jgi:eukaryotic-like serine/threonine-protein kinase
VCVDLQSAKILWEYENPDRRFPYYSSAAVTDRIVIVGGRDKDVHALDPDSGKTIWTFPTRAKVDSSPVIQGEKVIVGTTAGDLYTLDVRSGKPIWQYQTGSSIISSPSVAENKLIIGSKDGILYCFGEKNIS